MSGNVRLIFAFQKLKSLHSFPPAIGKSVFTPSSTRKKYGCGHYLRRVVESLVGSKNRRCHATTIFLYIYQGLDRIWHDAWVVKLIRFRFPGYLIKIIHSLRLIIPGQSRQGTFRVSTDRGWCPSWLQSLSYFISFIFSEYPHSSSDHDRPLRKEHCSHQFG